MAFCAVFLFVVSARIADVLGQEPFTARVAVAVDTRTSSPYGRVVRRAAQELAIEKVKSLYPDLLLNYTFYEFPAVCSATSGAVFAAEEHFLHSVVAYLGPECSLALEPAAHMAAHWNIPIYTSGGGDVVLDNKRVFTTLTRLAVTYHGLSEFVVMIIHRFQWRHVTVLCDESYTWARLYTRALDKAVKTSNGRRVRLFPLNFNSSYSEVNYTNLLTMASRQSRVFVLHARVETVHELLLAAHYLGYSSGDYVFFLMELFSTPDYFQPVSRYHVNDTLHEAAWRKVLESVLLVSLSTPSSDQYPKFLDDVMLLIKNNSEMHVRREQITIHDAYAHDSILLHAFALNETISFGEDSHDGAVIVQRMWNRTFTGGCPHNLCRIVGETFINANGDRNSDFALLDLNVTSGTMQPVAYYMGWSQEPSSVNESAIHWPLGAPPPDEPFCGFRGEKPRCFKKEQLPNLLIALLSASSAMFIAAIVILFLYRRYRRKVDLADQWWQVKCDEVVFHTDQPEITTASLEAASTYRRINKKHCRQLNQSDGIHENDSEFRVRVGVYKGNLVAVKLVNCKKMTLGYQELMEMKQMRELNCDNLVRFLGACVDESRVVVLCEFCSRGSLQDILMDEGLNIDWPFRFYLVKDIVQGMIYLHQSPIAYHGSLKSSNCVIDSRFVLKLTDFGLPSFRQKALENEDAARLLWCSPEYLRLTSSSESRGSQRADVYSFGIVLQEIITRTGPYECGQMAKQGTHINAEEIINNVKLGTIPPFRPTVKREACVPRLYELMTACWSEIPYERPTFLEIRARLKYITKGSDSGSFLDNLLQRMEKYANNLEQVVENRTAALLEEKRRSEQLLYEVLPRYVAEQLKQGHHVQPETFESVTIYFSDIVGFTGLSAESTPMQVIELLNDLYMCFDNIICHYDVYKVETIGDAYMVVSGLPVRNGDNHAREIARMALASLRAVHNMRIRHRPNEKLKLRIGIHSGPCAAGVVGIKMPRYCLFGDTVNTASRMESNGEALKIHCSPATKEILDRFGTFHLELRGEVELKGKGIMNTYWLVEEMDLDNMEYTN